MCNVHHHANTLFQHEHYFYFILLILFLPHTKKTKMTKTDTSIIQIKLQ